MSKKLVAYFSASGVTKNVAKNLSETLGADIYEIKPKVSYTKADLDWKDSNSRSSVEMKDKSFRPAVADNDAKIGEYDVVLLGFPIWWYVAPTIVNTFLEKYDFSGKTIIIFATSGSSDFGKTADELKISVSETAVIKEGKVYHGTPSAEEVKSWADSLEI